VGVVADVDVSVLDKVDKKCLFSACFLNDVNLVYSPSNLSVWPNVSSAVECQDLCQADPDCQFFVWNSAWAKSDMLECQLKEQTALGWVRRGKWNVGRIVGTKYC
jgi:hypothetical protein